MSFSQSDHRLTEQQANIVSSSDNNSDVETWWDEDITMLRVSLLELIVKVLL